MTVSDNTIQAERLGSFFENLGKSSAKASKHLATNLLKNPGRALEMLLPQLQVEIPKMYYQH